MVSSTTEYLVSAVSSGLGPRPGSRPEIGDWPGGPRTLTPREPNGTLWFGVELDPDGDQVWFRIAEAAVARMPAETPAARGRLLVDALIVWITPDRALQPGINRFEVRVSNARRHVARTAAVVKMDTTLAPTRPAAAELEDATLGRVPRRAPRPGPGAGERGAGGGRGVLPGPPRRPSDPGWGTDGPGPRRLPADRRQSRTGADAAVRGGGPRGRPRHQPRRRGRGRETEEVARERGRLDAVIAGLLFMAGMRRSEVSALRWADIDGAADGAAPGMTPP